MRSVTHTLGILLALVVITAASGSPVLAADETTGVRTSVDPAMLTPVPPPGATCWYTTDQHAVTCKTFKDFFADRTPVFDLPCGTVYENSHDHRDGIRHYVDGLAVRRFVHGQLAGTWSLAPDGSGRVVRISSDWISFSVWTTPGDDNTVQETFHGLQFRATASGLGNAILWFGTVSPDGTTRGIKNGLDADGNLTSEALAALARVMC